MANKKEEEGGGGGGCGGGGGERGERKPRGSLYGLSHMNILILHYTMDINILNHRCLFCPKEKERE